jgi:deferrochelatase/peroxidase EfeB
MSTNDVPGVSRRRVLGILGGITAGAAGAALLSGRAAASEAAAGTSTADDVVAFHGEHQAGITTPAQDRLHMVAFDVITDSRDELVALLTAWTAAAERMTRGADAGPVGAVDGIPEAPPDDTGEAIGLSPARLTLTFGVGPSLFTDADGRDRFDLATRRPPALEELPEFAGDALDPERSGGDLCIQACSDDPQVAVHAVRNLARIGFGVVRVRWSQLGFGRTSSTSTTQTTPRNLMGFKDGTANVKAEDPDLLAEHVWVSAADGPAWMVGGSYLVARRIRMTIETWDRASLNEQEAIFGRTKGEGGPLSGGTEFVAPDFAATGPDGAPLMPLDSHVRLAHPAQNAGAHLLRRGYNFVDGSDGLGRLDAGLFFLAYQRDPRTAFVPVQRRLAAQDSLNEYLEHVGSAVFAVPPGTTPGGWWAQELFA